MSFRSHDGDVSRGIRTKRMRVLVATALVLCLCASLASPVLKRSDVRDAVENLHGLTLWATIPYDHYGPGQPVKVYLTFMNRSGRTIFFQRTAPVVGVFTVDGKPMTFPQGEDSAAAKGPPSKDSIQPLAPGAHWLRTVVLKPVRNEFLPGQYPLRCYCLLDNAYQTPKPGVERRALRGTLVSNTVTVKIKYKVIVVY